MTGRASLDQTYIMGHSAEERERLIQQAGLFGPITERFLRSAGIGPGMRVLDVGCGVGDVSLLCADLSGLRATSSASTATRPRWGGRGSGWSPRGWRMSTCGKGICGS